MWDLPGGEQGFDAASTEFSPNDRLSLGRALCGDFRPVICPAPEWVYSKWFSPVSEVRRRRDFSPLRKDERVCFVFGFDGGHGIAAQRKADRRIWHIGKSD